MNLRAINVLEKLLGTLTAALLFVLMMVTVIDVGGRYFFGKPVPGSAEIGAILLALIVFGAFPLVSLHRRHITVDLFSFSPDSAAGRASSFLAVASTSLCSLWIGAEVWQLARDAAKLGDTSSFLHIPYAPIAFFIAITAMVSAGFALLQRATAPPLTDTANLPETADAPREERE